MKPLSICAQEDSISYVYEEETYGLRPSNTMFGETEKATMIAIGSANVLDTYLSAEQYKGFELRIISERRKPIKQKHLSWTISHHGCLTSLDNRAGNSNELGGMYKFLYSLNYNWHISQNISIQAGAGIDTRIGLLYNTRNSNNPVQVDASLQLSPSASVSYNNIIMCKRLASLRYNIHIPLVGVMFSPNYGQSYYELFSQGNYDHNIVPTTIASTPSLCHSLTFDIQIRKNKPDSKIRLGYLGDYQQSKVNQIKRHHYSHMFMIGWTKNI